MNVLLIEPDQILAQTYQRAMERAGITVRRAADVQAAVHLIDQELPGCIILEVQQAGHNGIEFIYEIRSYPDWQAIPIIIVSGIPSDELGLTEKTKQQLKIKSYHYKPHLTLSKLTSAVLA